MRKDVYIIKNDINDKVYIGQSVNAKQRFQSHCKPSAVYINNELIAKAIQKYGKQHFWYEILESQIEDFNEKEKYYIQYFNSITPNGYNIASGGEAPPALTGASHPESKLTEKQVQLLTEDLIYSTLSFSDLANKYGFTSKTSIYEFNKGLTYVREIDYPIRKELSNGKLNKNDVEEITSILRYTYRSFESIGQQYNVEARAISRINRGLTYHRNIEYPIRDAQVGKNNRLTYEQVTAIICDLLDTNLSLREIGRRNSCEYRDVLNIKNGTTKLYRRKELTYPLRPNN